MTNKAMIHTELTSTMYFNTINEKTGLKWVDSSYKNDICDSIICEDYNLHLFLPNSRHNNIDEEQFNTFALSTMIDGYYDGEDSIIIEAVEDVINYINDNYPHKVEDWKEVEISHYIESMGLCIDEYELDHSYSAPDGFGINPVKKAFLQPKTGWGCLLRQNGKYTIDIDRSEYICESIEEINRISNEKYFI